MKTTTTLSFLLGTTLLNMARPASALSGIVKVSNAGVSILNGAYGPKPYNVVPDGFIKTCRKARWNPDQMWDQLAVPGVEWYEHENGSYIYLHNDGRWWMDDPTGAGIYVCASNSDNEMIPSSGWEPLSRGADPMPTVELIG